VADDPSTIELLITFGVPGVIALAGVWLGKVWERRSAIGNWRRDRRLEAYSRLLECISASRDAALRLWARENKEDRIYEANKLIDAEAPLYHLVGQIELLGPDDVAKAADRAAKALMAADADLMMRAAADTHMLGEPLGDKVNAAQAAHDEFLKVARRALK
jgi:hypothetical protein